MLYTLAGQFIRQIATGPRASFSIAFDAEGNLWAFSADRKAQQEGRDYAVLACFLPTGEITKAVLSRRMLPAQVELGDEGPGLGGRFFFGITGKTFYMFIPQTQQFIEADHSGNIVTSLAPVKHDLEAPQASSSRSCEKVIEGLAVTSSGQVVSQFEEECTGAETTARAYGLFRLRRDAGRWEPIGSVSDRPAPGRLLGAKEGNLVFLVREGDGWKLAIVEPGSRD